MATLSWNSIVWIRNNLARMASFWFSEKPFLKAIRQKLIELNTQNPALASTCARLHTHTMKFKESNRYIQMVFSEWKRINFYEKCIIHIIYVYIYACSFSAFFLSAYILKLMTNNKVLHVVYEAQPCIILFLLTSMS